MTLIKILDSKLCSSNFSAKTKNDALKKMAEIAAKSEKVDLDASVIYEKLAERENSGSTGFGDGIAIPHARISGMDKFVFFILASRRGVEFESVDKKKVNLFFIVLGPEKEVSAHLQFLARISRVVNGTRAKREILAANSGEAIFESFIRNTRLMERQKGERQKMKMLYVVLYFDELLYDILEFFIQEGIEGATITQSYGMGEYISNIPLFAEFIGFMKENKNDSKTIMAMIPEDQIDDIIDGIEEITGDLDKKEGAMIFTLDVGFYKGSMKMM